MWCVVRTRRSTAPSPISVALAGACALLTGCQFDPLAAANGVSLPDGGGGTGNGSRADAMAGGTDSGTPPMLCTPGDLVCGDDGRTLGICNERGDGTSTSEVCPFSCEAGEDAHCTLASNIPESGQAACDGSAPRLTPAAGATVAFDEGGGGRITCAPDCGDGETETIDAIDTVRQGDTDLVWFCLSEIDIPAGLTVSAAPRFTRSVALLVSGGVMIAGEVSVAGLDASSNAAGAGGPGGGAGGGPSNGNGEAGSGIGQCGGRGGQKAASPGFTDAGGGGGGGGHGGQGGTGGDGRNGQSRIGAGGVRGTGCGEADLEPLVGGAGGGGGADGGCAGCGWPGGGGGGAIQIAAGGGIVVSGTIAASGGDGFGDARLPDMGLGGGGGGGAGGAILLEGPAVTVANGALRVEGGDGGVAFAGDGGRGGAGAQPTGGQGASASIPVQGGSGAGGGGGRVRLNASTGPTCQGAASPENVCTTSGLKRAAAIGGE